MAFKDVCLRLFFHTIVTAQSQSQPQHTLHKLKLNKMRTYFVNNVVNKPEK